MPFGKENDVYYIITYNHSLKQTEYLIPGGTWSAEGVGFESIKDAHDILRPIVYAWQANATRDVPHVEYRTN